MAVETTIRGYGPEEKGRASAFGKTDFDIFVSAYAD